MHELLFLCSVFLLVLNTVSSTFSICFRFSVVWNSANAWQFQTRSDNFFQ